MLYFFRRIFRIITTRFCLELKNAGANVLGIADAAYEELAPEVRGALTAVLSG